MVGRNLAPDIFISKLHKTGCMPRQNKQSKGRIKFGLKMDENSDKKREQHSD